jgi:integrase
MEDCDFGEEDEKDGSSAGYERKMRRLLEAPAPDTLKGVRDRAILATLLYHVIRREELCLLRPRDVQSRQGVMHFHVRFGSTSV